MIKESYSNSDIRALVSANTLQRSFQVDAEYQAILFRFDINDKLNVDLINSMHRSAEAAFNNVFGGYAKLRGVDKRINDAFSIKYSYLYNHDVSFRSRINLCGEFFDKHDYSQKNNSFVIIEMPMCAFTNKSYTAYSLVKNREPRKLKVRAYMVRGNDIYHIQKASLDTDISIADAPKVLAVLTDRYTIVRNYLEKLRDKS